MRTYDHRERKMALEICDIRPMNTSFANGIFLSVTPSLRWITHSWSIEGTQYTEYFDGMSEHSVVEFRLVSHTTFRPKVGTPGGIYLSSEMAFIQIKALEPALSSRQRDYHATRHLGRDVEMLKKYYSFENSYESHWIVKAVILTWWILVHQKNTSIAAALKLRKSSSFCESRLNGCDATVITSSCYGEIQVRIYHNYVPDDYAWYLDLRLCWFYDRAILTDYG